MKYRVKLSGTEVDAYCAGNEPVPEWFQNALVNGVIKPCANEKSYLVKEHALSTQPLTASLGHWVVRTYTAAGYRYGVYADADFRSVFEPVRDTPDPPTAEETVPFTEEEARPLRLEHARKQTRELLKLLVAKTGLQWRAGWVFWSDDEGDLYRVEFIHSHGEDGQYCVRAQGRSIPDLVLEAELKIKDRLHLLGLVKG